MLKRLLVAIPLAVIGAAWFYFLILPWPFLLRVRDPDTTAVMRQRVAEARASGEQLDIAHDWVPLDQISSRLQRAVVVAEDGRFRDHDGIDWNALREEFRYQGDDDFSWFDTADLRALLGSLQYYRENRDKVRGRSTITQQLTKNLYYSTDRSLIRKLEEFVVARRVDAFLSKDRILELYLNSVEWGPGIFGAEAASQHYFSRPAADLTTDQAASLAATLPHPLTINPDRQPGRMSWRKNMILSSMGASGSTQTVPLDDSIEPDPPPGGPAPIGEPLDPVPPMDSGPPLPPVDTSSAPPVRDTIPPPVDTLRRGTAPGRRVG